MQEKTGIIPKALESAPTVPPKLSWYVEQFRALQRDRKYEQGVMLPLGNMEIAAYFKMFNLIDFEDFHDFMVRIDRVYLDQESKREKPKAVEHTPKSKSSPPRPKRR